MSAGTLSRGLAALLVVATASLPRVVQAQETGRIRVNLRIGDNSLEGHPVMVSFISDGEVVSQGQVLLAEWTYKESAWLPPGLYDVRVEDEEVVTEGRRGIHIIGGQSTGLQVIVQPGQGLHVVEYATGGLTREEVAARLHRLERIVADLRPDPAGRGDPPDPESEPCCHVTAIDSELELVTAIEAATGRTFQFQVPDRALFRSIQPGGSVWADFDTGKVGLEPADPCCIVRRRP